ncbi:MAG: HEAT repeat domain-containing protein [Planctomycetes bacterium]|nr:HEAT repeat domain-containing protein [Planctomycetota bacterium]
MIRHVASVSIVLFCLVSTGCVENMETLRKDLKSTDPEVRLKAVERLGDQGSKGSAAVQELVDILRRDSDKNIRKAAAKSLGKIGDRGAIQPLKDVQAATQDAGLQIAIKEALTHFKE